MYQILINNLNLQAIQDKSAGVTRQNYNLHEDVLKGVREIFAYSDAPENKNERVTNYISFEFA